MSDVLIDRPELEGLGVYEFGWHDEDAAGAVAQRGLSEEVVRGISGLKNEPEWMLKTRLKGLSLFDRKPMPTWGADLSEIDFDNIKYFVRSTEKQAQTWEDLPEEIRSTYEKLGIPEAERQRLAHPRACLHHRDGAGWRRRRFGRVGIGVLRLAQLRLRERVRHLLGHAALPRAAAETPGGRHHRIERLQGLGGPLLLRHTVV